MPSFNFSNPVINSRMKDIYTDAYGENGAEFVNILEDCPYEVAVLSRLTAYIKSRIRGRR